MKFGKVILAVFLSLGLVFSSVLDLCADETGGLILKLLVKKGIISQKEANELTAEAKKLEMAAPSEEAMAKHVHKASWAERIKLKGDVRLRNEYQRPGTGPYVNRQRIRARAALEAKLTDTVKAGIGIASGGTGIGSARSTNQTLSQAFSTKPIGLDLAYVDWKPIKNIRLTGGKYKNPLYHPCDLLWDSDLRFEGASTNVKYNLEKDLNLNIPVDVMTNAGIFVLDDLGIDKKNPFLYVIQGGAGSSFNDFLEWKAFIGYLDFAHIADTMSMSLVPTSASMNMNGNYRHDYDVLEVSGEVTSHFLEQQDLGTFSKPLTFFVDYVNNLAISDKDNGWEIGAKLGKKKFKKFGDWRAVYNFRRLERDSFPDDFPDADAFRGRTDGFGHEAIFSYGLAKNIWLEFDYYVFRDKTRGMDPNDKWGQIIQLDLNTKF